MDRTYRGQDMDEMTKEDFDLIYQDARRGIAEAQFILGLCYLGGEPVEEDPEKAVFWLKKAAQQGDVEAQYYLSMCYGEGCGTAEDKGAYIYWLKKAAEQGYPDAQFDFAVCLSEGDGVEEDPEMAFEWFKRAAEQGHPDAQEIVASLEEQMARERAKENVRRKQKSFDWTEEPFEGASQDSSSEADKFDFASANEVIAHFLKFGSVEESDTHNDYLDSLDW